MADNPDKIAAKHAFMRLFANSDIGTPESIVYHVCGALGKDDKIKLVEAMISDQARQYGREENRIRYHCIGGHEASTQGTHNCLTWLRAHFSPFSHLKMPRSSLDRLLANPAHVVSLPSFFHHEDTDVKQLDVTGWQATATPAHASTARRT